MKKSTAIKLIMFFMFIILIPSVFAECLNSQGWVDLAKKHLKEGFEKNGIEREPTDAEIGLLLSKSISNIGRFDLAETNSYLETKSANEIGQILAEMNNPAKVTALEKAIESGPVEQKSNFDRIIGKEFEDALLGESLGGNAGIGKGAVNFVIDAEGNIVGIGNYQHLSQEVKAKLSIGEYKNAGFRVKVANVEGKNYEAYYDQSATPKQIEAMKSLEADLNARGKDYSHLMAGGTVEKIQSRGVAKSAQLPERTPEEVSQAREKLAADEVLLAQKGQELARAQVEAAVKVAVFSDQHGEVVRLQEMLIEAQRRGIEYNVFVGDYMDRGPSGLKVLDVVSQFVAEGKATMVLGNHDLMFLRAMGGEPEAFMHWAQNGGREVLKEAGINVNTVLGELSQNPNFLRENAQLRKAEQIMKDKGKVYLVENGNLYIHGGIPIDAQGNPYLNYKGKEYFGKDIFKGLDEMQRDIANGDIDARLTAGYGAEANPFWNREFGLGKLSPEVVDNALAQLGLNRLIVGHTPLPLGGQLNKYYGKVINVDGGLTDSYQGNGGMLILDNNGGEYYDRTRKELDPLMGVEPRAANPQAKQNVQNLQGEVTVIQTDIQKQKEIVGEQPKPAPEVNQFVVPKEASPEVIQGVEDKAGGAKSLEDLRIVLSSVETLTNGRGRTYNKQDLAAFGENIAQIQRIAEREGSVTKSQLTYVTSAAGFRNQVKRILIQMGVRIIP